MFNFLKKGLKLKPQALRRIFGINASPFEIYDDQTFARLSPRTNDRSRALQFLYLAQAHGCSASSLAHIAFPDVNQNRWGGIQRPNGSVYYVEHEATFRLFTALKTTISVAICTTTNDPYLDLWGEQTNDAFEFKGFALWDKKSDEEIAAKPKAGQYRITVVPPKTPYVERGLLLAHRSYIQIKEGGGLQPEENREWVEALSHDHVISEFDRQFGDLRL
ncbi:MAG: hypothetical protein ACPGRX_06045 [Bdellovibrionales bacterium]